MMPVSDERLAEYLGLDEFRVGGEPAGRDAGGGPRVLAWWAVSIEPSFERPLVVGSVHEEVWIDGPDPDRVAARGFVADATGAAVVPLDADEVLDALGRLNPFQVAPTPRQKTVGAMAMWVETAVLDGRGYGVRWGNRAAGGRFRFTSPRVPWLVEFERVLYRFARRVSAGEQRLGGRVRDLAASRVPDDASD
jgi:hypothetical protein